MKRAFSNSRSGCRKPWKSDNKNAVSSERKQAEIERRAVMSVARVTEIIASSSKSFEDALQLGIKRASKTLKNMTGAWIRDQKVVVEKGKIVQYRVNLKVTFVLDE
jgi:flavin-binding protein dodecin